MFTKLIVGLMTALMFIVDLAFAAFVYILIIKVYDKEQTSQFPQYQEYVNESRSPYWQSFQQHYEQQQATDSRSGNGMHFAVPLRPARRYDY